MRGQEEGATLAVVLKGEALMVEALMVEASKVEALKVEALKVEALKVVEQGEDHEAYTLLRHLFHIRPTYLSSLMFNPKNYFICNFNSDFCL
jgi:hypothetical protein